MRVKTKTSKLKRLLSSAKAAIKLDPLSVIIPKIFSKGEFQLLRFSMIASLMLKPV